MKLNIDCHRNLIIRKAEVNDAAEVIELVKQVITETSFFPRTVEEFNFTIEQEEEYIKNAELFLIAEVDGKIVGAATLDRSTLSQLKHTVTFGITILKSFCATGIGSSFMRKVVEWSQFCGIEKIDLEVFSDNLPAIALYKKFGFIEEGRKKNAIKAKDGYKDLILMGKFLR